VRVALRCVACAAAAAGARKKNRAHLLRRRAGRRREREEEEEEFVFYDENARFESNLRSAGIVVATKMWRFVFFPGGGVFFFSSQ